MQKNNDFFGIKNISKLKVIITLALFSAISIVLGKFLAIPVGTYMRFSFENLPLILSGVLFGPIAGCLCGITADLIGCVLRGYEINPILTIGAATLGFLVGLLFKMLSKSTVNVRLFISVFLAHAVASVVIKSIGLSFWYGMEFSVVIFYRAINYLIVAAAEFAVMLLLIKNTGFISQIKKLTEEKL